MGFRWVSRSSELEERLRALTARVTELEASRDVLRGEWLQAVAELEELHRRNLNTIRSLRRLASLPQDERTDDGEGEDSPPLGLFTHNELEEARRRVGG